MQCPIFGRNRLERGNAHSPLWDGPRTEWEVPSAPPHAGLMDKADRFFPLAPRQKKKHHPLLPSLYSKQPLDRALTVTRIQYRVV
jgi:hypothetical protein